MPKTQCLRGLDPLGASLSLYFIFRNTSYLRKPSVFVIKGPLWGPQRLYSNSAGGFEETPKFSVEGYPSGVPPNTPAISLEFSGGFG